MKPLWDWATENFHALLIGFVAGTMSSVVHLGARWAWSRFRNRKKRERKPKAPKYGDSHHAAKLQVGVPVDTGQARAEWDPSKEVDSSGYTRKPYESRFAEPLIARPSSEWVALAVEVKAGLESLTLVASCDGRTIWETERQYMRNILSCTWCRGEWGIVDTMRKHGIPCCPQCFPYDTTAQIRNGQLFPREDVDTNGTTRFIKSDSGRTCWLYLPDHAKKERRWCAICSTDRAISDKEVRLAGVPDCEVCHGPKIPEKVKRAVAEQAIAEIGKLGPAKLSWPRGGPEGTAVPKECAVDLDPAPCEALLPLKSDGNGNMYFEKPDGGMIISNNPTGFTAEQIQEASRQLDDRERYLLGKWSDGAPFDLKTWHYSEGEYFGPSKTGLTQWRAKKEPNHHRAVMDIWILKCTRCGSVIKRRPHHIESGVHDCFSCKYEYSYRAPDGYSPYPA